MIADLLLFTITFFCKILLVLFFRLRYSIRITVLVKVPFRGPYIITPNHQSAYDPPISGCFFLSPFRFMAKKELFHNPVIALFLRSIGAMPLERRGFDATTIRKVVGYLKHGNCMVIFPEGTRSKTEDFLPAKPGVGLIVHEADCPPIIPLRIKGTRIAEKKLLSFSRPKIELVYGHPFCINPHYSWGTGIKESSQRIADYIMEQVKAI